MAQRFHRTLERVENLDANIAKETETHFIYYCPFCLEKEIRFGVRDPKPDTTGKLYVHKVKEKGFCHRCCSIVYTNWTIDASFDKLSQSLSETFEEEIHPKDLPNINLDAYPLASTSKDAMRILYNRNSAFTRSAADSLGLRWYWKEHTVKDCGQMSLQIKTGIISPMYYKGELKSFQIRFNTNIKKRRFYTMDGIKILCTVTNVQPLQEITLCEGYYDAVALLIMGFPNPIALLGKTPAPSQILQLIELMPTKVHFALDDSDLNFNLAKIIRKKIRSISKMEFHKFVIKGKAYDPEEFYAEWPTFRFKSKVKRGGLLSI